MKLLLTSNGITNQSIATALFELVGKKPEDTSVAFIPTAANIDMGDKDWFIADLVNLQKLHFKQIDIADISALPEAVRLVLVCSPSSVARYLSGNSGRNRPRARCVPYA